MELKDARRSFWEYIVVGLVVGSALFLAAGLYAKRDFLCKSEMLRLELLMLRNRVVTHLLENKRLPENISLPPADPFGNFYRYNPKTGWVSTATHACREW